MMAGVREVLYSNDSGYDAESTLKLISQTLTVAIDKLGAHTPPTDAVELCGKFRVHLCEGGVVPTDVSGVGFDVVVSLVLTVDGFIHIFEHSLDEENSYLSSTPTRSSVATREHTHYTLPLTEPAFSFGVEQMRVQTLEEGTVLQMHLLAHTVSLPTTMDVRSCQSCCWIPFTTSSFRSSRIFLS